MAQWTVQVTVPLHQKSEARTQEQETLLSLSGPAHSHQA